MTCFFYILATTTKPPTTTSTTSTTTLAPTTTTLAPIIKNFCFDTLKSGTCLTALQAIYSCNYCFQFIFQADGNPVVYTNAKPNKVIWNTNPSINGRGGVKACMQSDGNFVISKADGSVVWSTNTTAPGADLKLQDDGQLFVTDGTIRWTSSNKGTCVKSTCGTFVKFNSNETLINNFGFSGGKYSNETVAYAGYANNSGCYEEAVCPARISTGTQQEAAGAYMSCSNGYNYDANGAYFAKAHEDFKWIPTDLTAINNLTGKVKMDTTLQTLFVGRKTMTNNFQTVSKIHNGPPGPVPNFWFIDSDGKQGQLSSGFDVLVCDPNPPCGE